MPIYICGKNHKESVHPYTIHGTSRSYLAEKHKRYERRDGWKDGRPDRQIYEQTDGRTDGLMDGLMDTPSYRVASLRLKRCKKSWDSKTFFCP